MEFPFMRKRTLFPASISDSTQRKKQPFGKVLIPLWIESMTGKLSRRPVGKAGQMIDGNL